MSKPQENATTAPPINPFVPGRPAPKSLEDLTVDDLQRMAVEDPAKAQQTFELLEALEKRRAKELDAKQKARLMGQMALREAKRDADEYAVQDACEKSGHRREDGSFAVSGQYDDNHVLITECVVCHRLYRGIGNEPGQLPPFLSARLNTEMLGNAAA